MGRHCQCRLEVLPVTEDGSADIDIFIAYERKATEKQVRDLKSPNLNGGVLLRSGVINWRSCLPLTNPKLKMLVIGSLAKCIHQIRTNQKTYLLVGTQGSPETLGTQRRSWWSFGCAADICHRRY
jgi:hypothetical protein